MLVRTLHMFGAWVGGAVTVAIVVGKQHEGHGKGELDPNCSAVTGCKSSWHAQPSWIGHPGLAADSAYWRPLQFNKHLFKLEQETYESENIDWAHVEFEDNQVQRQGGGGSGKWAALARLSEEQLSWE